MLKKRLVGVVIVKNGWAVQSFGYNRYLPLGKPECLVENLDRWGADEILVLSIDRSIAGLGPDFELLDKLALLGLETPLIYGGGIRDVADGMGAIQSGADRICVDALLQDDIGMVQELSFSLGVQAMIGVMPLSWTGEQIEWLNYRDKSSIPLTEELLSEKSQSVSELLIIDWEHEGNPGGFDPRLITNLPLNDVPLIAFGGISQNGQMVELLSTDTVAAIAVGNFLSYKEHAIQAFKESLEGMPLRFSNYKIQHRLLYDD